ncbi:integral membrane protein [Tremella mesenterica]|uniref:Glycerophosphocholine acyltransferase 1 n=1 Tax=Tremella mesenterica TaxID=5217 RepID=A0A4Q1BSQ5_TREME|nr:integral membrane protein [Tremella mesenterica]
MSGSSPPLNKHPDLPRPPLSRSNSSLSSLLSRPTMERYGEEWTGALTLLDVVETFFDSRLDLFNRRLKAQSARLRTRAVELIPRGLRTPKGGGILLADDDEDDDDEDRTDRGLLPGEKYRKDVEREVERIKVKLAAKVTHLSGTWRSAQIVRTREKVSFLFGVLSLCFTCLCYGMAPQWLPFAYTAQAAFYLPVRFWTYRAKKWHYFLFGILCYFVNALDLLWIWIFPSSTVLFIACYLLTLGPLASAIITWRNSLVFHSLDKVTSLFIHMYPPVVLTIIRHNYDNAEERYPGLSGVADYSWWSMILLSGVPYVLWQASYYKFISVDRKAKIASGERQNSFQYLLNDKRGPIGKALQGIRPEHREEWFIFGQLIYSVIFMVPPATLLIHSSRASSSFLILIFSVSAWNGASFYVEVFGRKFERELERLRKEMELASASGTSIASSAPTPSAPSSPLVDLHATPSGHSVASQSSPSGLDSSPLVLPGVREAATDMEVPELVLDKAEDQINAERKKTV